MPSKKDLKAYYRVKKWKNRKSSNRDSIINTIVKGYNHFDHITWEFGYCDTEVWPFLTTKPLLKKLKSLEQITIQSLKEETHGRHGKSSSHYINKSEMCSKAKKRLHQLNLYNKKNLFSLRLNGITRIFGFLNGDVFHILWLDKKHEIIPSKK